LKIHGVASTAELEISTFKKPFSNKSNMELKLCCACNTAELKLHIACDNTESFYRFIQPKSEKAGSKKSHETVPLNEVAFDFTILH